MRSVIRKLICCIFGCRWMHYHEIARHSRAPGLVYRRIIRECFRCGRKYEENRTDPWPGKVP